VCIETFVARFSERCTRTKRSIGVTMTEAIGKCAGNKSLFEEGVRRGDITIDTEGMYHFRQNVERSWENRQGVPGRAEKPPFRLKFPARPGAPVFGRFSDKLGPQNPP